MKLRSICKSKIHQAIVTAADLDYVGSIGIDKTLMDLTDIVEGEQVSVWNLNNGERIETYAIPLPADSRQIIVNGAAARHFQPGDRIIIAAFVLTDERIVPRMVAVDQHNRLLRHLTDSNSPEPVAT
jgi:aspartate 1-decarboxylase